MTPSLPAADIAADDPNWIAFSRTPRVCRFFNDHAILFDGSELRPHPHASVSVSKEGAIEEYTLFAGDFARPMGAFSYSYSPAGVLGLSAGRYCSIGNFVKIMGERHPMEWVTTSNITYCFKPSWNKPHFLRAHKDLMGGRWKPLSPPPLIRSNPVLGHDVWVADAATLATGISVGTGAVIGCGAVVTKDVEPYMVVAGNPARAVRRRFSDALCERLLASEWWQAHPDALFTLDLSDPPRFLDLLKEARASGAFSPFPVKSFGWMDIAREISTMPA